MKLYWSAAVVSVATLACGSGIGSAGDRESRAAASRCPSGPTPNRARRVAMIEVWSKGGRPSPGACRIVPAGISGIVGVAQRGTRDREGPVREGLGRHRGEPSVPHGEPLRQPRWHGQGGGGVHAHDRGRFGAGEFRVQRMRGVRDFPGEARYESVVRGLACLLARNDVYAGHVRSTSSLGVPASGPPVAGRAAAPVPTTSPPQRCAPDQVDVTRCGSCGGSVLVVCGSAGRQRHRCGNHAVGCASLWQRCRWAAPRRRGWRCWRCWRGWQCWRDR